MTVINNTFNPTGPTGTGTFNPAGEFVVRINEGRGVRGGTGRIGMMSARAGYVEGRVAFLKPCPDYHGSYYSGRCRRTWRGHLAIRLSGRLVAASAAKF